MDKQSGEQELFSAIIERAFKDAISKPKKANIRKRRPDEKEGRYNNAVQKILWAEATAISSRDTARAWLTGKSWDGKLIYTPRELDPVADFHLMAFTSAEAKDSFNFTCEAAGVDRGRILQIVEILKEDNWDEETNPPTS
jgi:hypothetical protein